MAKKLTVTLPDGTIAIRSTDNPYTHAVAYHVHRDDGAVYWEVPHWSRTESGAHKLMTGNGIVIPVNSPEESAKLLAAKTPKAEYPPYLWTPELIEANKHYANRSVEGLAELLEYEEKRNRKNGALFIAALKQVIARRQSAAFETGLVYDQPAPKYVFPLVIDAESWESMVNAELAHQDAEKMHPVLSDVFETGLVYDQPQPFTFDFKRGDVVEFLFAFPRTPAHKGWLKGVFYNVYPGDSRYACIRREGIYEAARLADIRKPLPVVTDIFDGMGDFVVKAPDSAKAA